MRIHVGFLTFFIQLAFAIYADEAGLIDYHLALLGPPGNSTTFFHQPVRGSKASLIYTLSEKDVIGAVNPRDGSLVWRRRLPTRGSEYYRPLSKAEAQDVLFTGVNDTAFAYSASDGRLVWHAGRSSDKFKDVTTIINEDGRKQERNSDAVVLWSGSKNTIQRLDAEKGTAKWTFDDSSGNLPFRVVSIEGVVYYLSLSKAMLKGFKLHLTLLDSETGKSKDQLTLSTEGEIMKQSDFVYVGACGPLAIVAWTDVGRNTLKVNVAGSKSIASFDTKSSSGLIERISIHSTASHSSKSHFLVEYGTSSSHWAQAYRVEKNRTPSKATIVHAYDLPRSENQGTFSSSTVGENVYFVRASSEMQVFSSDSQDVLARWPVKGHGSYGLLSEDWNPVHAASEVVARSDSTFAVRSAVMQRSGNWVLVRNGDITWTRPEQLTGIVAASWVSRNASRNTHTTKESATSKSSGTAFLDRLRRHFNDLSSVTDSLGTWSRYLLAWLQSLTSGATVSLKDHSFGFDKQVFALLENGNAALIDPSHPDIVETIQGANHPQMPNFTQPHCLNSTQDYFTYAIERSGVSGQAVKGDLWYFPLQPNQEVVSVTAPHCDEPIASIGKVMGDRSVLYKYLNPNVLLIMVSTATDRTLTSYLVDGVSGSVLYSSYHDAVDLSQPVAATISENWFAYAFSTDPGEDTSSRGNQLIMSEMYESELPNDRGPLGATSNYSVITPSYATPGSIKPHVISQTYHMPEGISTMTTTTTKQGITSRQLIVTLTDSNAIVGIPHQVLDPRRPVGKAPSNQQLEEGLMQYHPMIDFDPKWHLTHSQDVVGITNVTSSPSDMESTSLIFAYGLDVFGTRVAPSFAFDILSASFNKIQLVFTVVALTGGVFVVAPLINRKQTNALWQNV